MNFNNSQWLLWLKGAFLWFPLAVVGITLNVFIASSVIAFYSFSAFGEALTLLSQEGWDKIQVIPAKSKTFFKKISLFKPRSTDIRWMTLGEMRPLILRLARIIGAQPALWIVLADRLVRLWQLSGTRFTIAYLKECRLALLAWANSSVYTPNPGVKMRLSRSGVPRIIPAGLRPVDLSTLCGRVGFRALHTVFNLYRVMDWKGAKPDFSSITSPFSGVRSTLFDEEIRAVLEHFTLPTFRLGYVAPWVNVSSGPNHPWSLWGSAKDILGYSVNPLLLGVFSLYTWSSGQRLVALWLLFVSHLLLPVAFFLRVRGFRFPLGRLSVLAKDGGGKRRIVGVVDYWSQWVLRSLHLYLFDVLRRIPQDGTFDQMAPIGPLLDFARLGYPSFSFDLSNATDRLPVALQEQILRILSGNRVLAWSWRLLITGRDYTNPACGRIRYAVGQPIGALSSWAMLAVAHHVIVQVAAYRSGWKGWFPLYALLGDDIVILTKSVADEYISIMRYLGVPINKGKSIISDKGLIEFAKRVVSSSIGDLSGISGRELLQFTRSSGNSINLFSHLMNLGFIVFPNQGLEMGRRLGTALRSLPIRMILASAYMRSRLSGVCCIPSSAWPDDWFRVLHGSEISRAAVATAEHAIFSKAAVDAAENFYGRALQQLKTFLLSEWIRYPLFKGALGGLLSIPLLLISPAIWAQLYTLCVSVVEGFAIRKDIWWQYAPYANLDDIKWYVQRVSLPLPLTEPLALPELEYEIPRKVTARVSVDQIIEAVKLARGIARNLADYITDLQTPPVHISGLALPAPHNPSKVAEMQGGGRAPRFGPRSWIETRMIGRCHGRQFNDRVGLTGIRSRGNPT